MGLFDIFKVKEHSRPFASDADEFSTEEIWEAMNDFYDDEDKFPPAKSDEDVKSLISMMINQEDITLISEDFENNVHIYQLSIARNNAFDYVSVAYTIFNPNVVYITTSPFGFAGDRDSFIAYCNAFQNGFPMISIGCINVEREVKLPEGETGYYTDSFYAVRTCVPLLGIVQDIRNLLIATRSLPMYGYDLRDGFHSNNPQPYRSKESGINIQLEKLVNIHQFRYVKDYYPAQVALYGGAPFVKMSTDNPAINSNPYIEFVYFTFAPQITGDKYINFHLDANAGTITGVEGPSNLVCYSKYPGLYTIEYVRNLKLDSDDDVSVLFDELERFNFPGSVSSNPRDYALFKAILLQDRDDNLCCTIRYSMTQCIPNEIDAKLLAMQIAEFFRRINEPLDFFEPKN